MCSETIAYVKKQIFDFKAAIEASGASEARGFERNTIKMRSTPGDPQSARLAVANLRDNGPIIELLARADRRWTICYPALALRSMDGLGRCSLSNIFRIISQC
jgi:hypothetical protein